MPNKSSGPKGMFKKLPKNKQTNKKHLKGMLGKTVEG